MQSEQIPNRVLLFDGVCNLCNGAVQFIIKRDPDGLISFTSLQSETGQSLLKKSGLPTDQFDSFVFIEDGRVYTKSTAAIKVFRHLRGPWRLFVLFFAVPKPVRDMIYSFIAKNRYKWFGKKNECMLPSPSIKKRFLP
ncbi:thiol-disulfide oxidoreductase DCC family protein [Bacillus inaquosorum]|uniref:thiol-disulfide oxidoreductase DCC family protein n=1 Tax=Bacillus inaquosorum TaxID=483913 RepID=UPI000A0FAB4E|nr:thiol-disulfide oxidoreductase DCC family protein [Bacillus inaquosorum]QJC89895.1 YuxK [Bacillus subtilis]QYX42605.1 thiol-disulfide oxidoreductase DCC family protein [Bacillus inaquosorum]WNW23265.1 thiol-disulfide oxidoreductase DCC family protein [Bacillus inaquosorum]